MLAKSYLTFKFELKLFHRFGQKNIVRSSFSKWMKIVIWIFEISLQSVILNHLKMKFSFILL